MIRQVYDIPCLLTAFKTVPFLKYLAFSTWAQSDPGFLINLQTCLASIAKLKTCIPLKPSLPCHFGCINNSHLNQCALFSSDCFRRAEKPSTHSKRTRRMITDHPASGPCLHESFLIAPCSPLYGNSLLIHISP